MSVVAGTRIGPYQVTSLIGAGGMGEVYRARDTALGRDVALKVLPEAFAQDAERIARFRREAQVLASLNHPHIAAIYGLESTGKTSALALEFVDGEELSAIIARRALAIDDAVEVARQIAEALEAAHDAGVVHRDLKPGNIKRRPDGSVKVLDFGLAKAVDSTGAGPSDAASTQTSPAMTGFGMILGTAAYMSPEQAKGRPVDRRADIWAFGVVLFEMLTGRQLFAGETVSEVLAAVLRQDVDWTSLPSETPPGVRRLLGRCLDRDPRTRLRDIGEARVALSSPALATSASSSAPGAPSRGLRAPIWVTAAVAIVSAVAAALVFRGERPPAPPVARFDVSPPPGTTLSLAIRPAVSISSDGSTIVFAAARDGVTRLYRRRRGDGDAAPLPGTEAGSNPVISPDGRSVAFFADNAMKIALFDGPVSTVVSALNDPRGLTWVDASTIVYGPGATAGLMRITLGGGPPTVFTTLDAKRNERSHRWPVAIAGGRAVALTIGTIDSPDSYEDAAIDVVTVAGGERTQLFKGASMVLGDAAGSLLVVRSGVLQAVPFDSGRLSTSGQPVPLVKGVTGDMTTGGSHAALGRDGTLIYIPGDAENVNARRLVWADGSSVTPLPGLGEALYNDIRISPDGSKIAILIGTSGSGDVWLYDIAATTSTRLTFSGRNSSPVWTADSRTIYYAAIDPAGTSTVVWRRPADGSRDPERVTSVDSRANLSALEKDAVIVDYYGLVRDKTNVVRIPFAAGAKPETLAGTPFDEYGSALSRDGRWLAYQSDETGPFQIYVRDLSPGGGRRPVSTSLGEEPKWSPDGRTLYYRADDVVMAVAVDTTGGFSAGKPRVFVRDVFNLRSDTGISYDVDRKQPRLVMIRQAVDRQTPPTVRVVLNWFAELGAKTGR
jgi:serine/threonine-protein kinase